MYLIQCFLLIKIKLLAMISICIQSIIGINGIRFKIDGDLFVLLLYHVTELYITAAVYSVLLSQSVALIKAGVNACRTCTARTT